MLQAINNFLSSHAAIVALAYGFILYLIYDRLFKKLKKSYNEHLKALEKHNEALIEDNELLEKMHAGILRDKREDAAELKHLKKILMAIPDQMVPNEEYDHLSSITMRCQKTIEFAGRVGYVEGNTWRRHNQHFFSICFNTYFDHSVRVFLAKWKAGKLPQEHIDDLNKKLGIIKDQILDETSILNDLADEVENSLHDYFKRRNIYLVTSGPVPFMAIDANVNKGKIFEDKILSLLKAQGFKDAALNELKEVIINIVIYPISVIMAEVNENKAEPYIGATGCFYTEIKNEKLNLEASYFLPLHSRMVMEENAKGKLFNIKDYF